MYRNEHSPSKNRRIAIQGKKQISKFGMHENEMKIIKNKKVDQLNIFSDSN